MASVHEVAAVGWR